MQWRMDDGSQTLVLASDKGRMARVIYWGSPLSRSEDLDMLAQAAQLDVTGGMLDENPDLSICPEAGQAFPGQVGMVVADAIGTPLVPHFTFADAVTGKNHLTLVYKDANNGLTYTAEFNLNADTHVLSAKAALDADAPVRLHWLAAPVFTAPQLSDEMIDFAGRWCDEFKMIHTPWSAGIRLRENRTGRTGHEHFPGLIVPCRGASNTQGQVYAFHYGWSGGHRMVAEEIPDGRRQVQFGNAMGAELSTGKRFETATLFSTFSNQGLNGCAVAFQRHVRGEIIQQPNLVRPVHYNCWEAIYFDHSVDELKDIATHAAALGAERFVLDDGWFGKRDDDTSALGDWQIDARKYPNGLTPLINHVHAQGMSFGIWFEPEMINPDSDAFRAHPEWVLGDKAQVLGRQQLVLNLALSDVRDYLFDCLAGILSAYDIEYVKWDHNRVLPCVDADQTRGTYALLDRLREAFPKVEIESCASGGGRIDYGILERTGRVWLSDSNDALERLKIQHNAALFLPASVTGSHVGPYTCHTSGRTHNIRFRAWVAAQRHMGFEMDPRDLTPDAHSVLQDVTTWWKANREWMQTADILRLDSADDAVIAEQQLARDQTRFVVFAGKAETSDQIAPRPLRLTLLDNTAQYRIELINRGDAHHLSRGDQQIKSGPVTLSGGYLMNHGIALPWSFPDSMWVLEGTKL